MAEQKEMMISPDALKDMQIDINIFQESIREKVLEEFNDTCTIFLTKLSMIFKKHRVAIQSTIQQHQLAIESDHATEPLLTFLNGISDHIDLIMNKDDDFFMIHAKNMTMMKGIDIQELWGKCKPGTQKAIWGYLTKLTMFARQYEALVNPQNQEQPDIDADTLQQLMMSATENVEKYLAENNGNIQMTPEVLQKIAADTYNQISGGN